MSYYHTHDHGIIRVKVPVPFPLQWVNGYLLRDGAEYVLVDPGLHTEEAERVWTTVLSELHIEPRQIGRIVLTHHHPDHYGMAGWMQELTGCRVLMSRPGHELAGRLWGETETLTDELCGLFASHGLDRSKLEEMRAHMKGFIPLVSPQPEVQYIEEGEGWQAGQLSFDTVAVSGHAYHHLVFVDERKKLMLCGDHVLPRISPNISFLPDEDPDPLSSFFAGLDKLAVYEVDTVYPGHRDPFANLRGRVHELKAHHARRLQHMLDRLDVPATAYDVCTGLFGERLSIHQLRFALSETLAHLIYLQRREYVALEADGDRLVFARLQPHFTE